MNKQRSAVRNAVNVHWAEERGEGAEGGSEALRGCRKGEGDFCVSVENGGKKGQELTKRDEERIKDTDRDREKE